MPTPVSPEEADRIAAEYFAHQGFPEGYRAARAAELPELERFYYLPERTLPGKWTDVPVGSGGFFVSLSTGEVEGIGSGAFMHAHAYLRARDRHAPDVELSVQELAALLARYSSDQLYAMGEELRRKPL